MSIETDAAGRFRCSMCVTALEMQPVYTRSVERDELEKKACLHLKSVYTRSFISDPKIQFQPKAKSFVASRVVSSIVQKSDQIYRMYSSILRARAPICTAYLAGCRKGRTI
jgi:hypothetical protein